MYNPAGNIGNNDGVTANNFTKFQWTVCIIALKFSEITDGENIKMQNNIEKKKNQETLRDSGYREVDEQTRKTVLKSVWTEYTEEERSEFCPASKGGMLERDYL